MRVVFIDEERWYVKYCNELLGIRWRLRFS